MLIDVCVRSECLQIFFFFKWFAHNIYDGRLFLRKPNKCNNIISSQIKPTRIQKNSLSLSLLLLPLFFPLFITKILQVLEQLQYSQAICILFHHLLDNVGKSNLFHQSILLEVLDHTY